MANIETLVDDIYGILDKGKELDEANLEAFGEAVKELLRRRFTETREPKLRMSNVGTNCERKLWYGINSPEDGDPLDPQTKLKFLYGDLIEELLLFLSVEAGHQVEGRQDTLTLEGIEGHRDAVIDGVLVDTKSASGRGFEKFKHHKLEEDDPFGYIDQLSLYIEASKDDPLVKVKDQGAFLVINKENGAICLDTYKKRNTNFADKIERIKANLARERPPARDFNPIDDGKSGNKKLGVECSYCQFKQTCYPGVRTFLYSGGPRYLTHVERQPEVTEVVSGPNGARKFVKSAAKEDAPF